jgi:autotransporter-associated beta strand protein
LCVLTAAVAAGVFSGGQLARATTFTWARTGSSGSWATAANWTGGAAPAADPLADGVVQDLVFSSETASNQSNQLANSYTINSIAYANTTNTSTINTTQTTTAPPGIVLNLGAGGITANNLNYSANLGNTSSAWTLNLTANQTWTTNAPNPGSGAKTVGVVVPITGKAITKEGPGILILPKRSENWQGDANGVTVYLNNGTIRTGGAPNDPLKYQFGTGIVVNESANDVAISASSVSNEGGGSLRVFDNTFRLGGTGQIGFGGSYDVTFSASSKWVLTGNKTISLGNGGVSATPPTSQNVYAMNGQITGDFGFTKLGTGTLVLTGSSNTYTGETMINSGSISVADLGKLGTGSVRVNRGSLVVSDVGQLSAVRAGLLSAYNGGRWDGAGIGSTAVVAEGFVGTLGYGVVNGAVLVKYTLPGDADLDGDVDAVDRSAMSLGTGTDWAHGDFNYDGTVNEDDVMAFDLGAALGTLPAAPAVPEPVASVLLLLGAPAALTRRRRRSLG